ncbi:SusC/RagA family TonB-linked outer membrane protein [Mariniphaga sediminis]|uniref:SusC/RagA family TonB-linked outer membrane protein n=1 Tax=Mariniphaga sediminis TaxID=1628158 RepID=A0A399D1U2_9BACT|nr:TonB-dependent receptor [Mariniphaga sediminis]RIH65423.1 SusC/RagA family TonB-linked outer membrane protein [Mariniphaga sediminis]
MKKNDMACCRVWQWRKLLLMMKFVWVFILVGLISASASESYSQVTRFDLSMKNAALKSILTKIEEKTEFYFFYKSDEIESLSNLSIKVNNASISEVLDYLLKNKGFEYEIYDRYILILEKNEGQIANEFAKQNLKITGKVTDTGGQPLPGVTVVVKGTTQGTVTNGVGEYSITSIPEDAVLVFSFVGMRTQEVEVLNRITIDVTMVADAIGIEEVVAIGYGTQKKTSLTSSVAAIEGEELTNIPVTDLSAGIGGRLTGVITKQNSGEPGRDGARINIRGISTTGSTSPLLVVDGVPRSFQQLDPNNIKSITVLKDAAAVAPYGVAGANGVILVTTKSGMGGKPTLTYHGYIGFQNPTVLPDQVNSYEYAILKNEGALNIGQSKPYSDEVLQKLKDGSDPDAFPPYNDLYGGLIKSNSPLTKHNIEFSGGNESINYYASIGYMYQDGMWQTKYVSANANQYNLAMNIDAKVTHTTNVALRVNGSIKEASRPPSDLPSWSTDRIFELIKYAHMGLGPLWYSNGMAGAHASAALSSSGYDQRKYSTVFTQLSIEQDVPFIPGLKLTGLMAYDPSWVNNKIWETPVRLATINTSQTPYVITEGIFGDKKPILDQTWNQYEQLTYQAKLDYNKQIGKHKIGLLGVIEAKKNKSASLRAYRKNYDVFIDEINMGSSSNDDMATGGISDEAKQVGLVYRLNYDFSGKYLLEITGRYDGHYYFAPGKRFGFFPAFSAGWRISEEEFLQNLSWLYNLKLKASYGEVGALAGVPYQYMSLYNIYGPGYVFGGSGVSVARENAEPNKDITWERAKKTNIGIELAVNEGRIKMEADYFFEKRSNMLVSPTIITPYEYGIGLSQVNAGVMQNQGIEFLGELNYDLFKDFNFTLSGSFTYAKNKLLEVFESDATYNNPNRKRTGRPLGTLFGYESIGYFQSNDFDSEGNLKPEIATQPWGKVYPGDIRYKDANNDGKIDGTDEVVIGNPSTPGIIYGISPEIKYKNIGLDLFFQGTGIVDFYFEKEAVWPFHNGMSAYKSNFDYWTPENTNARNPRITPSPVANNIQRSSHWVYDVSYFRLKNITLSYAVPPTFSNRIGISNATVYLSGTNLFTWTKLKNIDPEIEYNRGNTYPQQKVVSIGVNLTF